MLSLDPRSLIAMGGFMALVMAVVLWFMRRSYPASIQGLGFWAWIPVCWLIGSALFTSSGTGPFELLRLLGNGFLFAGFALFHIGCRRFYGQPGAMRQLAAGGVLSLLALAWFLWGSPWYAMRVALVAFSICCVHAATLWFLWRHASRSFPVRLVQVTLLVHVLILLVRMQTVFTTDALGDLTNASTVQSFYIGAYVMAVLLLCIGAVLMATDRVRTELEHMATYDALTGALNRRAILELCEQEHGRSVRYGQTFSLMMVDLDHFKTVNDSHGHQHGDRVLKHFADRTRAALRGADRLGRYGGEEFLILLPNTPSHTALPVATRIHAALGAGHPLDCEVSIGVASWLGAGDALDAMLGRADAALYQAKAQGRNRTCVG